jgi:hypothetical protein
MEGWLSEQNSLVYTELVEVLVLLVLSMSKEAKSKWADDYPCLPAGRELLGDKKRREWYYSPPSPQRLFREEISFYLVVFIRLCTQPRNTANPRIIP